MKKFLFLVLGLLMAVVVQTWADELLCQTVFNASNNSGGIASYTNNWTNTTDGFTVAIVNANNNNNAWEYIKIGNRNDVSVGSVTTAAPIAGTVEKVVVTIDAVTASKINSIKLLTSLDGSTYTECASFTVATGAQTAAVPANVQKTGLYYQINFDCQKGSSNGLISVSKVEFYGEPGTIAPKPTATLSADAETVNVGDVVNFSFETQNTETQELVELVYQRTTATTASTTTDSFIEFTSSGTYSIFARIRVDDDKIINTDTISVMVRSQTSSATITASEWATEQELESGDSPESITKDGVTFTLGAGTGSAVTYASGGYMNMRAGNTLSVNAAEGYRITQIEFYVNVSTHMSNLYNGTWSSGSASTISSSSMVQWRGVAQDVSVTVNNVVQITSISVTYADVNQKYYIRFFDANGVLLEEQKVLLGATVTPPTPPAVADMNFIGWRNGSPTTTIIVTPSALANTIVRSDVNYYAGYTFDASVLNDTTTITANDILVDNGVTSSTFISFPAIDYMTDNKSIFIDKGTSTSNTSWFKSSTATKSYYTILPGNTIRVKSNCMMHKVTFTATSSYGNTMSDYGFLVTSGKLTGYGTYIVWEGSSADITISCTSKPTVDNFNLQSITIISDQNNTTATVTFLGLDGQIMQQQELALNSKVTPPSLPEHAKTGMHYTWDKAIVRAASDATYTAIEEPIIHLNATNAKIAANAVTETSGNYGYSLSQNNATLYLKSKSNSSLGISVDSFKVVSNVDEPIRTIYLEANNGELAASCGTISGSTWYGISNEVTFRTTTRLSRFLISIQVLSTPITKTVTFLDSKGQLIATEEVEAYYPAATSPEVPEIEGMSQSGWMIDDTFVSLEDFAHFPITKDLSCIAQYTIAEGYHIVTYLDKKGNVYATQYVPDGEAGIAPEAPEVTYYRFVEWQATDDENTFIATYEPDLEHATPIVVQDARAIASQLVNNTQTEDMYLVKGIVKSDVSLGEDNKVYFSMNWNNGSDIYVYCVAPIIDASDIQKGDTVVVFAYLYRNDRDYRLRNGTIEALLHARHRFPSAPAHLMYDFTGNGIKEYIDERLDGSDNIKYVLMERKEDNKYTSKQVLFTQGKNYDPKFLEDLNGDGQPDISMEDRMKLIITHSYISGEDGYSLHDSMAVISNFDINNDGRQDYINLNNSQQLDIIGTILFGDINYQQADGSFHPEPMQVMTWSEYQAQMSAEELDMMNNPLNYSLGDVSRYHYTIKLEDMIGVALARAPRRNRAPKAQGIGYLVWAPTKAIDLNGDGLTDLIDEKNGVIYTNMGHAKWVMTSTNGIVIPADLNGDGITDFIFPGNNLYVMVYNTTTNSFALSTLYSNAAVDDIVYAQDFDRDGDIDLLATFSAVNNTTNTAYTCFFSNDGNGNFTRQAEQSYGPDNLLFRNLQDIDGDGYMDLLAFRDAEIGKRTYNMSGQLDYRIPDSTEVVWLQGQSNLQFAQATPLFGINSTTSGTLHMNLSEPGINAEDINNDGKIDIWLTNIGSRLNNSSKVQSTISMPGAYTYPAAQVNAAPTAPAAPALQYNDSTLTITWGDGSDDHTMACDLTYALRIGTSSGAMDILRPHANADGSRRNFLDGNMGRAHSYTIHLSSYAPGTIYVAVQAIDAQHTGSAWSEEATVRHEKLPTEFTISREVIRLNEKLTITYTPMPEEYIHTWSVEDGVVTELSTSQIEVSFPTGGKKTITHTLTSPDNKQAVSSQTVRVLPADVSRLDNYLDQYLFTKDQADINYDGRGDILGYNAVMVGSNTGNYATQAEGLWNTNFLTPRWTPTYLWYDYNHDGQVDLVLREEYGSNYQYAYLPHDANAPTLSDRVNDDAVEYLFGYNVRNDMNAQIGKAVCLQRDFTHNGRYDIFETNKDAQNNDIMRFLTLQENGTYAAQASDMALYDFTMDSYLKPFTDDVDHDGFADIALMGDSALKVAYNRGEGIFDIQSIPFASAISSFFSPTLVDFNGDRYLDLLFLSSDTLYLMWNDSNTSFAAPIQLQSNVGYEISILDMDANGYPDIAITKTNPVNNQNGLYVCFMGSDGIEVAGNLIDDIGTSASGTKVAYLACGEAYIKSEYSYRLQPQYEDVAPSVPTGLTTQATADGLLIQWNDAEDDHTPAALMRYNLSVRLQGSDTYLISPLNGGNNGTMPLSNYGYINATQFLIPTSVLTTGSYEIQLQALDIQQHFSDFTPIITVSYTRTNSFEMVNEACTKEEVLVSYRGEVSQNTPVWDFDGGSVVAGSGYGPYTVTWNSGGDKRVSITVDGVTYADTITISNPEEMQVNLPTTLLMEQAATAVVPDDVISYIWYAKIGNDYIYEVGPKGINLSALYGRTYYDKRLTAEGLQITAHEVSDKTSLTEESVTIYLEVFNANGCSARFYTSVTVIGGVVAPTLDLVTVDANAHNIINFTADATNFPQVRILKETNVLNQFAEVAVVPATSGSYTDITSDATQQPDRYKIQGVMANGDYSTESAIHKTVHATINRGVREGTYNLIWNAYEGAEIVTYNILRGSSAATLTQIASVASSATSYTDQAPMDAEPYYVVEYVLASSPSASPARRTPAASQATLIGRSNIVERESGQTPPEPVYYTIRFLNYDGSELQLTQVPEGERPVYTGTTPTKPEDDNYTYEFSGWSPAVLPAFADTDYTAQFKSTQKSQGLDEVQSDDVQCTKVLIDGEIFILRGEKVYTLTGQEVR